MDAPAEESRALVGGGRQHQAWPPLGYSGPCWEGQLGIEEDSESDG